MKSEEAHKIACPYSKVRGHVPLAPKGFAVYAMHSDWFPDTC